MLSFIIKHRKERRHFSITLSNVSNPSEINFRVTVANPGHRLVTIKNSPKFKPLKGKYAFPVSHSAPTRRPYELKDGGEPIPFRFKKRDLAAAFIENGYSGDIRFKVEVADTLDKTYKSKAYEFNIDEWAK